MAIEDEYEMVNGVMMPKRLKRKPEVATMQVEQAMEQPMQPQKPSTMERITQFVIGTKKKSPEQTPGTLASMQEQGRILREAKANAAKWKYGARTKQFQDKAQRIKYKLSTPGEYPAMATRGTQVMEKYANRMAAMPKRFAGSAQGARRIEKGYKPAATAATGVAGMLFPMTGLQRRLKSKGMSRGRAGRPAGVYKHVIPGVGPVHVYTYRKWLRAQRRKAAQAMSMREQAMAQAMMKRGLPPQMAYAQAEQFQQLRQQQAMEEAQQMQEMPEQYQSQQPQQQMQPQPQRAVQQQSRAPINMLGAGPINHFRGMQRQGMQGQQQAPQGMKPVYDVFTGRTRYEPNRVQTERFVNDTSSISRPGQIGLRKQVQGGYY